MTISSPILVTGATGRHGGTGAYLAPLRVVLQDKAEPIYVEVGPPAKEYVEKRFPNKHKVEVARCRPPTDTDTSR